MVGHSEDLKLSEVRVCAADVGTGTRYGSSRPISWGRAGHVGNVVRSRRVLPSFLLTRLRCPSWSSSSPDCFNHLRNVVLPEANKRGKSIYLSIGPTFFTSETSTTHASTVIFNQIREAQAGKIGPVLTLARHSSSGGGLNFTNGNSSSGRISSGFRVS